MNPWLKIPEEVPYVLKDDRQYIDVFNEQFAKDDQRRINLKHIPEPRLGPTDAPVVILQLNPSFGPKERGGVTDVEDRQKSLSALRNEQEPHKGAVDDKGWWQPRLKELRSDLGKTLLSESLLSVEFFPYRSRKFCHGEIRLPSQEYTFHLVRSAIEREAVIIVSRNWKLWYSAIPELYGRLDETVFTIMNPRSSYYSRNNIGEKGYAAIIEAVRSQ